MAILSTYVEQVRGVSYKPINITNKEVGVGLLRANNIQSGILNFDDLVYIEKEKVKNIQYLRKGDILICASSGSKNLVGKAAIYEGEENLFTFGAFCKVIRIKDEYKKFDKYISLFFQSNSYKTQIKFLSNGANINNITTKDVDNLLLLDFELKDIDLFVSEVNNIFKLIKIKQKQILFFDELTKSRFNEMFGDPLINNKGFKYKYYGDLFNLNAGGTPSKKIKEYWDNGNISWIGSNLCQNTILTSNDGKYITDLGLKKSAAKMFDVDTVLIALVGATIGKTALLKFKTTTNQNVLGVQDIKKAGYNPYFVWYYTQQLYPLFLGIGDGGFNMASKKFISNLEIYDVDIELQNEFADFIKLIDKSKFIINKQIDELQELFDSKMDEYFG